jgi:hypothetical protein
MANSLRLVFSNYGYVGLAGLVFVALFFMVSALSEYFFYEPYIVLYVPDDRVLGFVLIVILSVLSGLVIPMNVYRIRMLQNKARKVGGSFIGSFIGASAGACSCGPVGFAVISTFGTIGGTATAFLTAYEIPMRIASIAILGYVYYTTNKSLVAECRIKN